MPVRLIAVLGVIALAGCTAPKTGIVPIGDGIYMSHKMGGILVYSGGQMKAELFAEARDFCGKQSKQVVPVSSTSIDAIAYNNASAEVQFRCQ